MLENLSASLRRGVRSALGQAHDVEADLGIEAGVRTVDFSLATVARVRELFPMFRQRRL